MRAWRAGARSGGRRYSRGYAPARAARDPAARRRAPPGPPRRSRRDGPIRSGQAEAAVSPSRTSRAAAIRPAVCGETGRGQPLARENNGRAAAAGCGRTLDRRWRDPRSSLAQAKRASPASELGPPGETAAGCGPSECPERPAWRRARRSRCPRQGGEARSPPGRCGDARSAGGERRLPRTIRRAAGTAPPAPPPGLRSSAWTPPNAARRWRSRARRATPWRALPPRPLHRSARDRRPARSASRRAWRPRARPARRERGCPVRRKRRPRRRVWIRTDRAVRSDGRMRRRQVPRRRHPCWTSCI